MSSWLSQAVLRVSGPLCCPCSATFDPAACLFSHHLTVFLLNPQNLLTLWFHHHFHCGPIHHRSFLHSFSFQCQSHPRKYWDIEAAFKQPTVHPSSTVNSHIYSHPSFLLYLSFQDESKDSDCSYLLLYVHLACEEGLSWRNSSNLSLWCVSPFNLKTQQTSSDNQVLHDLDLSCHVELNPLKVFTTFISARTLITRPRVLTALTRGVLLSILDIPAPVDLIISQTWITWRLFARFSALMFWTEHKQRLRVDPPPPQSPIRRWSSISRDVDCERFLEALIVKFRKVLHLSWCHNKPPLETIDVPALY